MSHFVFALVSASLLIGQDNTKATANTATIRETVEPGTQNRTRMHLVIRGKIRTSGDKESPLRGQALLEYGERVVEAGPEGSAKKIARYYDDARAKFVVGDTEDSRQVRPAVRFMVGERASQSLALWSPAGALASDERELVEEVLDSTRLALLLPPQAVEVGGTWKPDLAVLQSVFDLDNISESNVTGRIVTLEASKATIEIDGTASGLSYGAEVKAKAKATLSFDRVKCLIDAVTWEQTDNRGPSPVSPPGEFEVKIVVTRKRENTPQLSDQSIGQYALDANPASKLLVFESPDRRCRFYYDRNWHLTTLQPELAVFRRMVGNELVGQLNVTLLANRKPGTRMKADEFQKTIEESGGWTIEQILRTDDLPTDGAYHLQLMTATGQQGELKLIQRHYLATSAAGNQVVFSFIVEPGNEEKLGNTDLSLVGTVEFPTRTAGGNPNNRK